MKKHLFITPAVPIPSNYKLLVKLNKPIDLKWGIPSEIMIDSSNKYFIISYDYNPAHMDLYSMSDWKLIKRIDIKGYTYLYNSYFYLNENAVYIDRGRNNNNYVKIDLTTFNQTHITCDKVPRGCEYDRSVAGKKEYYNDIGIITENWYLIKYNDIKAEVYLKK
jgi:hypothetical protein